MEERKLKNLRDLNFVPTEDERFWKLPESPATKSIRPVNFENCNGTQKGLLAWTILVLVNRLNKVNQNKPRYGQTNTKIYNS